MIVKKAVGEAWSSRDEFIKNILVALSLYFHSWIFFYIYIFYFGGVEIKPQQQYLQEEVWLPCFLQDELTGVVQAMVCSSMFIFLKLGLTRIRLGGRLFMMFGGLVFPCMVHVVLNLFLGIKEYRLRTVPVEATHGNITSVQYTVRMFCEVQLNETWIQHLQLEWLYVVILLQLYRCVPDRLYTNRHLSLCRLNSYSSVLQNKDLEKKEEEKKEEEEEDEKELERFFINERTLCVEALCAVLLLWFIILRPVVAYDVCFSYQGWSSSLDLPTHILTFLASFFCLILPLLQMAKKEVELKTKMIVGKVMQLPGSRKEKKMGWNVTSL